MSCSICNKTTSEEEITCCLSVLESVIKYYYVKSAALLPFCMTLSRTVLTETFVQRYVQQSSQKANLCLKLIFALLLMNNLIKLKFPLHQLFTNLAMIVNTILKFKNQYPLVFKPLNLAFLRNETPCTFWSCKAYWYSPQIYKAHHKTADIIHNLWI